MTRIRLFTALTLVLAAIVVVPAPASAQLDALLQRASTARAKGTQGALVTVYEIADFQCPFCGDFARTVYPQIDSAYIATGMVQWVFVNLPLPNHANGWVAAEAALCAGAASERFWPLHDRLFAEQAEWSDAADPAPLFARYAREAGVPQPAFDACVAGDQVATLILRDVLFAASTRVNGTPAFVINNEHTVMGVKPFEEWRDLLEREIAKKAAAPGAQRP